MMLTTREKILRAALQLFFEHGYKDTSYDMLIHKTGLSKGAIYHHFKSKEELLIAVCEFFLQESLKTGSPDPLREIKDFQDLKKLVIETKSRQFRAFQEMLGGQTIKLNRLLFSIEAISENRELLEITVKIWRQEMEFLKILHRFF